CPLNVDSLCIGYPARPMTCMGHHSLDVQDCIDDMNDPEGEPKIRKSSDRHGMMQFHHVVLTKSLRAIGCDATELEYIPALRIALEDNEAGTKYANGEANFSEADMADVRQAQTEDPYRKQP
ncbi:MAG TPA: hypothetical protein VK171_04915, partial [Fimbriimonas sp.]|nr:hypothetical protein [Fimbriimonas sp.]